MVQHFPLKVCNLFQISFQLVQFFSQKFEFDFEFEFVCMYLMLIFFLELDFLAQLYQPTLLNWKLLNLGKLLIFPIGLFDSIVLESKYVIIKDLI